MANTSAANRGQHAITFEARERMELAARVRAKLNISALVLARLLGLPESAVEEWDYRRRDPNKANAAWMRMLEQAADSARDPHRLGRHVATTVFKHGRAAAWYIALHAAHYRLAPRRKGAKS